MDDFGAPMHSLVFYLLRGLTSSGGARWCW